jgi:hypothetical protein
MNLEKITYEIFVIYIYSIPITYEVFFHVVPNYKNLFDNHHTNKLYTKIKDNIEFIYSAGVFEDRKYEEKPNPRVKIIGNSINNFKYFFINGKAPKLEDFYIDFENGHSNDETRYNRVRIEINEKNIEILLFANFDKYGIISDDPCNKYIFPFQSITREFEKIFLNFNKDNEWEYGVYDYNKKMVKKFFNHVEKSYLL